MDVAACAGYPVEIFFPERGGSYVLAKVTCDRCAVVEECRREIDRAERELAEADVQGMYAGETPAERIRRRRAESWNARATPVRSL
jgi:transcription factor WhiB